MIIVDNNIGGVWRTIGGRRIFIKDGQNLVTAMKESGKFPTNTKFKQTVSSITTKKDKEIDGIIGCLKLSQKEHDACNKVFKDYKNNNNENILLIDINNYEQKGKIDTSNSRSSVGFSKEQEEIMNNSNDRSLIAIHNHPGNGTFSLNDIYTMVEYEKIGGIMVVTDDYVYSLKPDFNKGVINISDKGYDNNFETKLGDANDEMLEKYPMYSNNQLYHMAYKKVFDEMGWEYGREKRK